MKRNSLDSNNVDLLVASTKSVLGAVPFAGPLLSEIVGSVIPNQRIDRLTRYIQELEARLALVEDIKIENVLKSAEGVDLIEESFYQASRALTEDRRGYISNIVVNGIDDSIIDYSESKYLFKILEELNEQEVIWLRFYLHPTIGGDEEFREKHSNVLEPIHAFISSDERTVERSSLQESYKEHLERLGLIRSRYRIDRQTGMPQFDKHTGKPSVSTRSITPIGKLLLKQIGLYGETNA
ncbi:hypothetical protein ACVTP5_002942 [Vibrio parahaemolyticus]|uniref:hypothetical protein n=1 Tax=Vibrio harveyi group TaxID=717610 RepID=UPI0004110308|nr:MULTISPECIES: hypothetical protein [Vibrio harveyi group]EGQ8080102.1 hypothetical protein [Vibrio vulnificus]EGQ9279679.1 hypothetical protein [Vibrio vulnificus]EHH0795847.1 hypothetical protein [Vibrio vulnificus]EHR7287275.1 hypothetical protein [Vibrio parahaemolyticus]EJL7824566.1 hypothetical protein [Vibrio parahaemolyticus]